MSRGAATLPPHWERLLTQAESAEGPLGDLRRTGAGRLRTLAFPGPREEAWRFTSLRALERLEPEFPSPPAQPAAQDLHRVSLCAALTPRLAFFGGRHAPAGSAVEALPEGLTLAPLASVSDRPEPLATQGDPRTRAFADALAQDGALVRVAPKAVISAPVHLVFWTARRPQQVAVAPRIVVDVARGAEISLVVEIVGDSEAVYLNAASVDLRIGENASVRYTEVQRESDLAFHLNGFAAVLERNARLETHHVALGGRLARTDMEITLAGDGAACDLSGLYLTGGKQHMDFHTFVDHAAPHTVSREKFKGVLDGKSTAVFNGRVRVREDAQKIDSVQANNNLLLSRHATVNTNPELEIFADDVKAAHGATVGQIEEEQLFYLRSRGISREAARRILIKGFAGEMIERLRVEALRDRLMDRIGQRFS